MTQPLRPNHLPGELLERERDRPLAHLLTAMVVLLLAGLGAVVLACARACAMPP